VQITASFEIPIPRDRAWKELLDVESIAPCMPGATLDGRDGDTYQGRVKLKIGPILAQYTGKVSITDSDESTGRLTLLASGKEQRGSGRAEATVLAQLSDTPQGTTRVDVDTSLNLTGKAAQFGRSILEDVAKKLVQTFADNLAAQLSAPPVEAATAEADRSDTGTGTGTGTGSLDTQGADPSSSTTGSTGLRTETPAPAAAGDINVVKLLASSPRVRIGACAVTLLAAALVVRAARRR